MKHESDDIIEIIQSEVDDLDAGTPIYRIRSYPSDPDLETLYARWKRKVIQIPIFQRAFVWSPTQASRLIESFLMGLPVPGIFVFVQKGADHKQLVIDGQQRLRSVFSFFDGFFPDGRPFRLTGVVDRWQGKRYEDLDSSEKTTLLTSVLRVVNIEHSESEAESSSVYQIFERLNTGGTALTPQEIRNSSYHGPFNDMLIEANTESVWRRVFGRQYPDTRMRDIELIVRFLALHEGSQGYSKPMRKFISDFMARHQHDPNPSPYSSVFLKSVENVFDTLGEKPFHIRRGINVAVFDSVMCAFALSDALPADITSRYEELKQNERFIATTSAGTTDVPILRERLELAHRILFK